MQATIRRSEAWAAIQSGRSFDLEYVTADVKRRTGGKIITCIAWQKVSKQPSNGHQINPGKPVTEKKAPNHYEHKTLNIYNPQHRALHPHKVHYRLMLTLNGKRVING